MTFHAGSWRLLSIPAGPIGAGGDFFGQPASLTQFDL